MKVRLSWPYYFCLFSLLTFANPQKCITQSSKNQPSFIETNRTGQDTTIWKSLHKTKKYLASLGTTLDLYLLPLLHYIERKYPTQQKLVSEHEMKRRFEEFLVTESDKSLHRATERIFTGHLDTSFAVANLLPDAEKLLAYGMNVRTYLAADTTAKDSLRAILRRSLRAGDYSLTHAALAYQWLKEDSILPFSDFLTFEAELLDSLHALTQAEGLQSDLGLEALAVTLFLRPKFDVPNAWIQNILKAQDTAGTWFLPATTRMTTRTNLPLPSSLPENAQHQTVLAYWILCHVAYNGGIDGVKMLR
jgi:hypothetical protein